MKRSAPLIRLSVVVAVLGMVAAAGGLFWQGGPGPFSFSTLRGETVQIHGRGLYRYDTAVVALGFKAADAVTLAVAVPLLLLALVGVRRGSLRAALLLTGTLAYFLYTYGSLALGAAYNPLFPIYVAIFSASLFGLVLALQAVHLPTLPSRFSPRFPVNIAACFLIASASALVLVWAGLSILPALLAGEPPPEVASYTTGVTLVLDLGIVAPTLLLAGVLLLRRAPVGYLLGATVLVFYMVLGMALLAGGLAQLRAGLLSAAQFSAGVVSFAALTAIDLWLTGRLFRSILEP